MFARSCLLESGPVYSHCSNLFIYLSLFNLCTEQMLRIYASGAVLGMEASEE